MPSKRKRAAAYTDGSCSDNPGPGGFGVVLQYGARRNELSGGFRLAANNRMEPLAVIKGLETLKRPCAVSLYADSKYIADAVNKGWARRRRANGWRRPSPTISAWTKSMRRRWERRRPRPRRAAWRRHPEKRIAEAEGDDKRKPVQTGHVDVGGKLDTARKRRVTLTLALHP